MSHVFCIEDVGGEGSVAELFPAMLGAVMNESIFIQYKSIVSSHVTDAGSKANGDIPCGY